LAAVEDVAGVLEDLGILLDLPHALRASATIVALIARKVAYGRTAAGPVDPGCLSILSKGTRYRASAFPTNSDPHGL
jgi:hypothetical protein